jgi:hypothetical protein
MEMCVVCRKLTEHGREVTVELTQREMDGFNVTLNWNVHLAEPLKATVWVPLCEKHCSNHKVSPLMVRFAAIVAILRRNGFLP